MKKSILTLLLCLIAGWGMAQNAYTHYEVRWASNPRDAKHYDTERLRKEFLIQKVMAPGEVNWTYSLYDRFLVGGAEPVDAPLELASIAPLDTKNLLDNRELGIINIGGDGVVTVDGKDYPLAFQEALYIGRGSYQITVSSKDAAHPAKFYLNSACAQKAYPIKKVTLKQAHNIKAGSLAGSNDRVIHQMIIDGVAGVHTCQLQMGITELKEGSVWNTMPAHTHLRRMETYFYYKIPEGQQVLHIMGEPQETRPIWVKNEQAVISPQWSIHCGAGTSNYTFIWGMAGENLIYTDMQVVKISDLK
ncbi:MAG: 5-dehydro-4-deoxy-D-glucuronate isomerase [Prevotella sp.]|jgi:4-deoxy-L-threo-5-hexosulose-uronate ketol-isomerase|nr:5-dehydro-4-deoxy-D-glucuronate isomerase [Prevotella sp.]MCH3991434.1 5-dehydro-4-deoxy-D-glucuronate isomerase [Prevotella sp.]MCI1474845.1 5-dehydro-4-deoxy-D-glucuronate isomerase [Prevotella sp.]MCI1518772.1 5-dehydro-4-deoxy-D-glucuronate isomerase [Prevotella sp.]MCI1549042.1 5-dehydro-4-deoxy-D-glucuronate isomerase [Prevotella sp.]MCI1595105.1 5-dehydro-4-deoxy-D-glucuronate isomerase [Prevotella sp.]